MKRKKYVCPNCGYPTNEFKCPYCHFPVGDDVERILRIWQTQFLFENSKRRLWEEVRLRNSHSILNGRAGAGVPGNSGILRQK